MARTCMLSKRAYALPAWPAAPLLSPLGAPPTGFVPIDPTLSSYAGVLVASVAIEELARYGIWRMHR